MKSWTISLLLLCISFSLLAQNFEFIDRQDNFQAAIGETVRIPIKIKNSSAKAQFYIIRKVSSELGSSQKGYFCWDKNCLETGMEEFSKRIEPGETLSNLVYVVEGGLQTSVSGIRFQVFPKGTPAESMDYTVTVSVVEKNQKPLIFQSKDITIEDVYPNPVQDIAFIHYRLHNDDVSAKVVIHNILGSPVKDIELSAFEDRAKIMVDELVSGIYFYTLYLNNTGVLTRKLIIRK
jgi:hypothetical protein